MPGVSAVPGDAGWRGSPVLVGDYELVRSLGVGADGRTWLARPPGRLGLAADLVAIEVLDRPVRDAGFAAIVEVLQVVAAVRSPHLVRLLDVGRAGRLGWVAFEWPALGSLAAPARPLGRTDAVRAVAAAARGAHALHQAGLAHGAVSPSTVLLGAQGAALGPLALGRFVEPGLVLDGDRTLIDLDCTDPGMLLGEPPSRASDVWSLGATLHRVLTGASLVGVVPDVDVSLALRRFLAARPTLAGPLSPGCARVVIDCLHEDPADRPTTAELVAERLEWLLRTEAA